MYLPLLPSGIETVITASSDVSTTAAATSADVHTTTLTAPDFAWTRGYSWYPDTPGAYPDSKWTWYYNDGGLYDQAHSSTAAPTSNLAADVAWQRGYSWYSDTPGAYPASKWGWYPDTPGAYPASKWSWYPDTPGQYPASKMDWYYSSGGMYDKAHQLAAVPPPAEVKQTDSQGKGVRASPGHLLMCGHACLLGLVESTARLVQTRDLDAFPKDFSEASHAAAAAVSPVTAFVMREHVLPPPVAHDDA